MRLYLKVFLAMLCMWCALPILAAEGAPSAPGAEIMIMKQNSDAEKVRKARDLPYILDFMDDEGGDTFLIVPDKDGVIIEVLEVRFQDNGQLALGKEIVSHEMSQRAVFVLKMVVAEGIPGKIVCLANRNEDGGARSCWVPRYSGISGALILDPGFRPLSVAGNSGQQYEQASAPLLTEVEPRIIQPFVMVKAIKDENDFNSFCQRNSFKPIGAFYAAKPHKLVFIPMFYPMTIEMVATEENGGDIRMTETLVRYSLKDDEIGVFCFDVATEENGFVFKAASGDDAHLWWTSISSTGELGGFGYEEHFIAWPDN